MKKNKGITLIALVITIIILLILAGIGINFALGEHGILNLAKVAKNEYENAYHNEIEDLDDLYSSILVAGDSKVTLTMDQLNHYIDARIKEQGVGRQRLNLEPETKAFDTTYTAETDGIVYLNSINGKAASYINVYDADDNFLYGEYSGVGNNAYDYRTTVYVPKGCKWVAHAAGTSSKEVTWFKFE